MEKLTYQELKSALIDFNEKNGITTKGCGPELCGVIVFKSSNWPDYDFSLECRSYRVSNHNKAFIPSNIGYSIFAESLDHSDSCRLEAYIKGERGNWEVEYCYLERGEEDVH